MTEFSSGIPFKKSPCCFASPRGSKSVVLQFVNDTVLKNWKQVKQVRYQTIKQVGHLIIYKNLMSLVVAWVADGICFGDLATRRLVCVARVSVSIRSKQRLRIWPREKCNKRHFSRGLWLSFLVAFFAPKPHGNACHEDYEKTGIKSKDREKVTGIKSSLTGLQCRLPMQKCLVKIPPDTLVIMTAKFQV